MRHGFLLVDKPKGITSHDAVLVVRKILSEKHVGHLGTLDPAASGLLVLAVGAKALKVIELFSDLTKEYEAEVRFGAVSTTYDAAGVLTETIVLPGWEPPTIEALKNTIEDRFLGRIRQVPPAYSAVHIGGERAYRKAMQGREVNIPPRDVFVQACTIRSYHFPDLALRITCGSGTYIRSLAHDLGQVLRFGAYLSGLQRTKVGEWSAEHARAPENVLWTNVIPLKEALSSFPRIDLTSEEFEALRHGRDLEKAVKPTTFGWHEDLPVVMLEMKNGKGHARKVL
ncbi:MAG: tRNA pseudouridine(55) synthase TruB [Patescibacteria group bacterium]